MQAMADRVNSPNAISAIAASQTMAIRFRVVDGEIAPSQQGLV
jgi:hypothetical protein